MIMNYRSIAGLSKDILNWLDVLPTDIDVIVGVPRSGLLVANLLSLYRNLPLTDIDGLIQKRLIKTGARGSDFDLDNFFNTKRRILIVDDSMASGRQLQQIKERILNANLEHDINYGVVYVESKFKHQFDVDYFYSSMSQPRCFEWNLFHHNYLNNSCVDIDGVLCRDPNDEENDDGSKYRYFIDNVKPKIVPTKTIGWLVTCRLEKYRPLTEQWLKKHGIKYNNLAMMNLPDKATRLALGSHGSFKASVYKKNKAELFIESSLVQAKEIARLTNKNVLCTESMEMVNLGNLIETRNKFSDFTKKRLLHPISTLKKSVSLTRTYLLKRSV